MLISTLTFAAKLCRVKKESFVMSKISLAEEQLRKVLQKFNQDLGEYINDEERFKLGRVLTIVDAAIADPEQRKAIKDLVNNEWWNNNIRSTNSYMTNPHSDLRAICELFGFELYPPDENTPSAPPSDDLEYIVKRYREVALKD